MERQKILDNVWIRAFLILCAIAIFFTFCYFLKGILISLFLAFTIAYIFDPVVDFLSKTGKRYVPRGLAIAIMLVGILLVVGGLLTYTVPKTITGIQHVGIKLKEQSPKYFESAERIIGGFGDSEIGEFLKSQLGIEAKKEEEVESKQIEEEVKKGKSNGDEIDVNETKVLAPEKTVTGKPPIPEFVIQMKKHVPQVLNIMLGILKKMFFSTFGLFGVIMNIVVFGVVTVYLLKDFNSIMSKGKDLLPVNRKEKISGIMSKIDGNLKAFFRGQFTVCIILSVIYGIGLTIIGVPMSYLLAALGGFGNIIPYIGLASGLIPALILTFIQFQDITHLLLVGLVFGIGQFLEGTVITPKIVGTKLGLNPVAIILAILVCSQVLGFLGLLLAVPIASVIKVLIDEGIIKYKDTNFFKGS